MVSKQTIARIFKIITKLQLYIFTILFSSFSLSNFAQQAPHVNTKSDSLTLGSISLEGNKRTKDFIIYRELEIQEGARVAIRDTATLFELDRNKVFNTGLFTHVDFIHSWDSTHAKLDITVKVNERWYIWPIPIFELADRNFNEWWHDRGRKLNRVDWGIRFRHDNFRGRNERLKLVLQQGFTKKYELIYTVPNANEERTAGFELFTHYSTNKAATYRTNDHKLDFFDGEEVLKRRFWIGGEYRRRPKYFHYHALSLRFQYTQVADTIALLNPQYFREGNQDLRFFRLDYHFVYDRRNIQYYPTEGHYLKLELNQYGLGVFDEINQTNALLSLAKYWSWDEDWSVAAIAKGKVSTPVNQAYFTTLGLGWGQNLVRGYELNVIDGQHYGLFRSSLKWRIFHMDKFVNPLIPLPQFKVAPFAFYLKLHNDVGYVWDLSDNPLNTRLANSFLMGTGIGLDIVTYYDVVWRFEFSRNLENEYGFFLHFVAEL